MAVRMLGGLIITGFARRAHLLRRQCWGNTPSRQRDIRLDTGIPAITYTQFYGDYLIHSVKYYQGTFSVLDGRMGMNISEGCIRLPINQAKWIWDNVSAGTKVVTYR